MSHLTLPQPATFSVSQSNNVFESEEVGDLHLTYRPDTELQPRLWSLQWTNVRHEVVEAIWQHFEAFTCGTFLWTPPGGDKLLTMQWRSAPSVEWQSAVTASVTADLEELLAFVP